MKNGRMKEMSKKLCLGIPGEWGGGGVSNEKPSVKWYEGYRDFVEQHNRPHSDSRYLTGTSLQWRPLLGNFIKNYVICI